MLFFLCSTIIVSSMHNTENVVYIAISSIAINPAGNLLNIFIKEIVENWELKFGKNQDIIKNDMVTTPAII